MTEAAVCERIREQVRLAGSIRALAKLWGVSTAYLSDVVNGKKEPGQKILDHICITKVKTIEYRPIEGRGGDPDNLPELTPEEKAALAAVDIEEVIRTAGIGREEVANARRLVACWNLLERLPTEFIERAAAELTDVEELGGYEIERLRIAITNAECMTPGG